MSSLDDSKLWKLAIGIAEEAYTRLDDFPEEEKWGLAAKLRGRSGDVTTHVAEALGSIDPRDTKWLLGKARSNLFAVKSIYQLAHKTGILPIIPESMVKIEAAAKEIDTLIGKAADDIPLWFKEMENPKKDDKQ
jgi:four helix bundle protein